VDVAATLRRLGEGVDPRLRLALAAALGLAEELARGPLIGGWS
jgi:hypothetical protein